jgi:hypothetical protein
MPAARLRCRPVACSSPWRGSGSSSSASRRSATAGSCAVALLGASVWQRALERLEQARLHTEVVPEQIGQAGGLFCVPAGRRLGRAQLESPVVYL